MAVGPANVYQSYTIEGMREDLGPIVFNIDPLDTPFMNSIQRGKATQVTHEWQTDTLRAAQYNAAVESNESTFAVIPPTVRPHNMLQISERTLAVAGTLQAVTLAGRAAEVGYQLGRLAKALKRDCEFTLCQEQNYAAGSSGNARQLASFERWITGDNADRGTSGVDETFVDGTPTADDLTDGTQRALQENMMTTVLQACWTAGGDIDLIMAGPFNKRQISGFAGNSTRFDIGEDQRLTSTISVYISDYGEHRIVANRFSRDRTLLLVDTQFWAMSFLRPFRETPLAKTGDSEKRLMNVEYTLAAYNAKSSGVVADLTTGS